MTIVEQVKRPVDEAYHLIETKFLPHANRDEAAVRVAHITSAAQVDQLLVKNFYLRCLRESVEPPQCASGALYETATNLAIIKALQGHLRGPDKCITAHDQLLLFRNALTMQITFEASAIRNAGVVCQIKDVTPIAFVDEPKKAPGKVSSGLQLTDMIVIPHWGDSKYQKELKKMKDYYEEKGLKTYTLKDGEIMIVDGGKSPVIYN